MPYMDRLDYVSTISQEETFAAGIEMRKWIDTCLIIRRPYLFEHSRCNNHLLAAACHIGDVGAISFILWSFESREYGFEFIERVTGARLHANYERLVTITNEL